MLQIENLTKTYAGNQKPSVDNLSLTVNDGEIFGFIGPNGAGKSTTIKSITGIISFEEGRVLIDGIDLKTSPLEADKGNSVFFSSHVLEVVEKVCDRIGIIDDGHLITCCRIDELKERNKDKSLEELFLKLTDNSAAQTVE